MSLHTQDFEFVKANNGTNGINEPSSRFNNLSSLGNGLSSEGKKSPNNFTDVIHGIIVI